MRRLLALLLLLGLGGATLRAEDWTVNGKEYRDVVVGKVHITYDGGIGTLNLADLPPDLQKRFNSGASVATAGPGAVTNAAPATNAPLDAAAAAAYTDASAAAAAEMKADAGHVLAVNVGGASIKLSEPPGMLEIPAGSPMATAIADQTPSDCQLLRACVTSDILDPAKAPDPSANVLSSRTYVVKDLLMDIGYGDFINIVQQVAFQVSHGVLIVKDSPVDYAETEKRLDQFQKDTGVAVKEDSDLYSLGMISRSDGCVAFLTAQYLKSSFMGRERRSKCVSVVAYILVKKKIIVAVTSLNQDVILHKDIRDLMQIAERYQYELQMLNNP